jgi:uncharacterized membrane protein YphA (DoxX/SURF4 family)
MIKSPLLHLALRLALGGFFVYASLNKIQDPAGFARVVYQWQILSPAPANLVAIVLPWVEALAGVLLIAGLWKREAAAVIAALLLVFLLAAGSVMARGIDVENCGCTSTAKHEDKAWWTGVGWFLVVRNLAMLGAALLLIRVPPREGRAAVDPVAVPAPPA